MSNDIQYNDLVHYEKVLLGRDIEYYAIHNIYEIISKHLLTTLGGGLRVKASSLSYTKVW